MSNFERKLDKILNEMYSYSNENNPGEGDKPRSNFQPMSQAEKDAYIERLRMKEVGPVLWGFYLGGYKKTKLRDLPHIAEPFKMTPNGGVMLSNGKSVKVGDRAQRSYEPNVQKDLFPWLIGHLGPEIMDMTVQKVMRKIRQYTEMSQQEIESNVRDPFGLEKDMPSHRSGGLYGQPEDTESEPEDEGEYGLGGDWWK